ncbi:MAG: hypothetical protein P8Y44_00565 [Acidobacteriota bacterium]
MKCTARLIRSALFVGLALTSLPTGAADSTDDSVVEAVLSMLEAGVDEDVIISWLDSGEETIPRPRAEQLIMLQEAGATGALLERLLNSAEPSVESSSSDAAASTSDAAIIASAKLPSKTAPPSNSASRETSPPRQILLNFDLSYSPWYLSQDEYDEKEDGWDFFVYMDGIPISYVPAAAVSGLTSNLEFSQLVDPGPHLVRATLERHRRDGKDRWSHTARVAEEALAIEISPSGPEASLTVRFKENWGRLGGGPLDFVFTQGDRVVELESVGAAPETWPLICEEIEANLEPGAKPDGNERRDLDGCVRWSDLWQGRWAPPRNEVRDALAMFDYRPVPKGS